MNPLKIFLNYTNLNLLHRVKISNRKTPASLNIYCSYCSRALNEKFNLKEDDDFYSKIIYNEVIHREPVIKKRQQPIFMKYLTENNSTANETQIEEEPETNFPFTIREEVLPDIKIDVETAESNNSSDKNNVEEGEWKAFEYKIDKNYLENPQKWDVTNLMDNQIDDLIKFGTCDPDKPVSKIPCGGCGAFLHCNDASIPGFIPKEVFENCNKEELGGQLCQRCHFLKTFNVALGVHIPPAQYEKILSSLKNKPGLVIFIIDLLDFPCSIYPEVFNLIGPTKPVVVVGNKVDLLMQEDPSFLSNFKKSLKHALTEKNLNVENIKHMALISAKTGYGVEDLISTLQTHWGNQGDVYLIGCTNSGKSSLFNALIQSDYCKINAADILQRATVSAWPGTTLNLLKFPIAKAFTWRLAARQNRLIQEREQKLAIERLRYLDQNIKFQQIPLADHVGRTLKNVENSEHSGQPNQQEVKEKKVRYLGINPKKPDFAFSKWFYDTPGLIHQDQILNLLTTPELLLTLPTEMLIPRNFRLQPGYSIFIGGIARLDYILGPDLVWFTVFASMKLPVTVTKLEDAALVYQKLLGSPLFRVPAKGKKRLSKWPDLASKKIEIYGKTPQVGVSKDNDVEVSRSKEADADVVLTSAGWVSVNVPAPYRCFLEAWTPEGRGIHVRKVPMIKKGHIFRGPKISKTPAYQTVVKEVTGYSIMDEPPF